MNTQVFVAIITVGGSILVASVTFYLNERAKRNADWQQKKFGYYKNMLSLLSELTDDGRAKVKINKDYEAAFNTSALFASQEVIVALMAYQNEIRISNPNKSDAAQDRLLKQLLLAIRKDIGLSAKDNPDTFEFHMIATRPKSSKKTRR